MSPTDYLTKHLSGILDSSATYIDPSANCIASPFELFHYYNYHYCTHGPSHHDPSAWLVIWSHKWPPCFHLPHYISLKCKLDHTNPLLKILQRFPILLKLKNKDLSKSSKIWPPDLLMSSIIPCSLCSRHFDHLVFPRTFPSLHGYSGFFLCTEYSSTDIHMPFSLISFRFIFKCHLLSGHFITILFKFSKPTAPSPQLYCLHNTY